MHIPPKAMPLISFGECLKIILAKRKISGSELARMMAYKSRNSIFRMLEDEGGHGARQAFFDRLLEEDPLALTAEEKAQLTQAVEINRVGVDGYLSSMAMRSMLMDEGGCAKGNESGVLFADEEGGPDMLAKALDSCEEAEMLIISCCRKWFFDDLYERISRLDPRKRCTITHYVYMDESNVVSNISAIRPMLYHPDYTAYCVEPGMFCEEKESLYRNNWVLLRYRDKEGAWHGQDYLLIGKGRFCTIHNGSESMFRMINRIFKADMENMHPLKISFESSAMTDYLAYTQECLRLEMNRAIYMIKLDVPISCVQAEILLPMVKKGFAQMAGEEELPRLIDQMEQVHRQRWDNLFTKKKPTHIIFSREAMEKFARTGRQSDHLHVFPAYTAKACEQILRNLCEQTKENEYFSVHFFREDFKVPLTEVGLYEGVGTLMTKPYTHYDLNGSHAESIIRQKEFCRQYKRFYTQDLLERYVISEEETLSVLDHLIGIARRRAEAEEAG